MRINYFNLLRSIIETTAGYPPDLDLSKLSEREVLLLLKIASSNRVLFVLCKQIKQNNYFGQDRKKYELIDKILIEGERINRQYANILKKIKENFEANNIPFLVVKTDRKVDYVLSDIDILIEEKAFNKAQLFLSQISTNKNINEKEERWHYEFGKQAKIDLHRVGTDWYSKSFFDIDSIWKDTEQRLFLDEIYQFPSRENEWILNAVNIIYERFSLTYFDFLHFKRSEVDYKAINEISRKHGWDDGLRILFKYLNIADNAKCGLPLMFSFADFLRIFLGRLLNSSLRGHLSLYYFLYIIYCKLRFWLSGGYKISYAGQWYKF